MGKKKKEVLDKEFVPFSEGMRERGYSDHAIKTLWDILVPFADYAFNKAHTAAYGLISYWTAYLKQHYGPEYMAALLTSVKDDKDKSAIYLNECRRMKIQVLPPDVNSSDHGFVVSGKSIRFGLDAVKNVGHQAVEAVIEARERGGPFSSIWDFCDRVDARAVNKRAVECLVKCGALDSTGATRRGMLEVLSTAQASASKSQEDARRAAQTSPCTIQPATNGRRCRICPPSAIISPRSPSRARST